MVGKKGVCVCVAALAVFVIAGSLWAPLSSFGGDVEELKQRINELEKKMEEEEKKNRKKSSVFSRVRLGGYAEIEYEDTQGKKSTFDNHRLIFNVSSQITKRISFNSELEFEHGTESIELEQAYIDFELHNLATARVGAFLVPLGRLNLYHDAPLLETTSRPLVDRFIIPTTWTDVGLGSVGLNPFGNGYLAGYEAYISNGLRVDDSDPAGSINGSTGLRGARPIEDGRSILDDDNNNDKALSGRVFLRFSNLYEVGISGYTGNLDEDEQAGVTLYAFDLLFKYSLFELAGEYAKANITTGGLPIPSGMDGLYLEGRVHLLPPSLDVPDWATRFTAFYRYDEIDLDKDVEGPDDRWSHVIGANYRPIPTVAIKGEYQFNNEKGGDIRNDTLLLSVAFYF